MVASTSAPLEKFYAYWTTGTHLTPTGLSRYHGNVAAPVKTKVLPRQESAAAAPHAPSPEGSGARPDDPHVTEQGPHPTRSNQTPRQSG